MDGRTGLHDLFWCQDLAEHPWSRFSETDIGLQRLRQWQVFDRTQEWKWSLLYREKNIDFVYSHTNFKRKYKCMYNSCLLPGRETKYEPPNFLQKFLYICVWYWVISQSWHVLTSLLNLQLQKLRWKTLHKYNHYKVLKQIWMKDSLETSHSDLLPCQSTAARHMSCYSSLFAFIPWWWHNVLSK